MWVYAANALARVDGELLGSIDRRGGWREDLAHPDAREVGRGSSFDANDAISGALERRITTGVNAPALSVILAVDLNHETLRGSQEVCDEATEQRHLPAKDHAELPAAKMVPQELLGCSERAAQCASALREDRRALAASRRKRGHVAIFPSLTPSQQ